MRAYIFDIDGTLADATHRVGFVNRSDGRKRNWKAFFELMAYDEPIPHMREVAWSLSHECLILYCTGRPEEYRQVTISWLGANIFPQADKLYMREDGDYRDDALIKQEMLIQIKEDGYKPIMAFDDRTRVVKMWRANGIPCAQVAEGDF